jgi:hypothetical protein
LRECSQSNSFKKVSIFRVANCDENRIQFKRACYIRACYDKDDFPTNTPAVSGFFSIERTRNRAIGPDGSKG